MPEAVITPEQEEADFAKGFDAAVPTPASPEVKVEPKTEPVVEAKSEAPAAKEEPKVEAAKEVVAELIGGLSEADWNTRAAKAAGVEELRKEIRQNFGQIGELKRALTELSGKFATGTPSAARKFTAQALKRVHADFPDLAESLAADLTEALSQAQVEEKKAEEKGVPFNPDTYFTEKLAPALEAIEARSNERAELRIVKSLHRDFETVVKTPEFAAWLGTLSPEKQTEIRDSEDGFVAADAVSAFKEAQTKAKTKKETSKTRLEQAVTPQGEAGSQPVIEDDEAQFAKGFKQAGRAYAR